jgi:hypothetical protein
MPKKEAEKSEAEIALEDAEQRAETLRRIGKARDAAEKMFCTTDAEAVEGVYDRVFVYDAIEDRKAALEAMEECLIEARTIFNKNEPTPSAVFFVFDALYPDDSDDE